MKKPLLALLLIAAVATAADQSNPCEREECVTMTRAHYDKLIGTILFHFAPFLPHVSRN